MVWNYLAIASSNFKKTNFLANGSKKCYTKTLCNVSKKTHIAVLLKTPLLFRPVCDLTIKTEPIFTFVYCSFTRLF